MANSMEENNQLSAPTTGPAPLPTPLKELHNAMKAFFAEGIKKASYKFCALKVAVLDETTVIQAVDMTPLSPFMMPKMRWGTSTVVATLVLILAATADPDLMNEALDFFGWQSLTLPQVSQVTKAESADFAKRFAQAKKAAIDGKVGEMTVLGVHLVDIEKLERLEKGCAPREHCSFMHAFAVAIGREGFRVYQAWGEPSYRIDEYMKRGGSKLRGWDEGKKFVKNFSRLSRNHETWTRELFDAYNECFEVDLRLICGEGKPMAPVIPTYRPWVRIYEIGDVRLEDIRKFTWKFFV